MRRSFARFASLCALACAACTPKATSVDAVESGAPRATTPPAPSKPQLVASERAPSAMTPDQMVDAAVAKGAAGVAIAVLRKGEVVWTRYAGMADRERGVAMSAHSVFDLASVSKPIVSLLIGSLVEQGKLTFDEPARKLLPELGELEGAKTLTIRHLLQMTSGLADYTADLDDAPDPKLITNTEVLRSSAKRPLEFPPGTRFDYSNTNYALLALVAERVTKQPFASLLKTMLFDRVGMHRAAVFDAAGKTIAGRVRGYERDGDTYAPVELDIPVYGDGNIFASLEDLIALERALWNAEQSGSSSAPTKKATRTGADAGTSSPFITRETLRKLTAPGKTNAGEETEYGMGWNVMETDGRRLVDHSGSWAGTATYWGRYPTEGVSIIVLSNDEAFDLGIADRIIARYLGP